MISAQAILVDGRGAAELLGISERHFHGLERSGRIGPMPIKLGRSVRYSVDELRCWARDGCLPRNEFIKRGKQ